MSRSQGRQIPGQSLDSVQRLLLDPYDVTYGILTADEAAAFSIIPNGILGAKLASAYNDWLLEHWLQEDARPDRPDLRGALEDADGVPLGGEQLRQR